MGGTGPPGRARPIMKGRSGCEARAATRRSTGAPSPRAAGPLPPNSPFMTAPTMANRNCPYWVREMVAAYAAQEPLRDFERDWSDEQAGAFRSGQSFFTDETREASFARVARLAQKLSVDYDAFVQFVRKADW